MNTKKESIITITILVLIVLLVYAYTWMVARRHGQENQVSAVPAALVKSDEEMPFTDIYGNPVELSDTETAIRIVNVWASWSPESGEQLRRLSEVASEYSKEPVVIIAINRGESRTIAQSYLSTVGDNTGVTLVLDPADSFYQSIGGYAMPETIFYNTEGETVYHSRHALSKDEMRHYIEKSLKRE